jgi:hypothetical protein
VPAGTLADAAAGTKVGSKYHVGDLVTAAFGGGGEGGEDAQWYPGKVSRVHQDGRYDISYTDGDTDEGLAPKYVKAREDVTDPALWHVLHEDGDEEDLDEEEVEDALLLFEKSVWRSRNSQKTAAFRKAAAAAAASKPVEKAKVGPSKYEVGVEQLRRSDWELQPRAPHGVPAYSPDEEVQQVRAKKKLSDMLRKAAQELCDETVPRLL